MEGEAILSSNGQFTSFILNGNNIRFRTSPRLEKYTRIVEWDYGYIEKFLSPIKKVRIQYE